MSDLPAPDDQSVTARLTRLEARVKALEELAEQRQAPAPLLLKGPEARHADAA